MTSMLPFHGLSVCLSVCLSLCVMFVHCAQMAEDIDTISFAYVSPMSLPDRVKIWLTSVHPFIPKFCPKVIQHPVGFSRGYIRWQIAAEWWDIVHWSQWRVYREPPLLISNGMIDDPIQSPLPPKWGLQMHRSWATSRQVLPPGKYDRRAISAI